MARWKKQPLQAELFKKVFEQRWMEQAEQIDWENEESAHKDAAWLLLETYLRDTPIQSNEVPEAVEVPLEADLSKHSLPTLIGVVDLVRAGGRIVDFKTSGKTPNPDDALRQ